ncbi:MAG: porin family protein [Bacteroidota bacterium]
MNRNDEQFDEFLRSQFKHKTFDMKDQYWKNTQQMIATHRATAGQGMLSIVFSGIVLVALSVGLLWNSAHTPSAAKQEQPAFLASALPQEIKAPVETGNVVLQNGSNQPGSNASNSSVSAKASNENEKAEGQSADAKPKKQFIQHQQRTRKSVIAEREAITTPPADEQVTTNTVSEITYIDGKVFRSIKGTQNRLATDVPKPDLLAYTANRSKGFLAIEGGLNSYNHTSDFAQSFNFHAGLRYYRFLSPTFAVSSGLTYSRLQQNLDTRVFRNVDYSFGQQTSETKISTLRLDYIEIPVSAYYNLKGNHFVQAGATLGYALQSHDLVESNGNKGQSDNGYMDGINKMDVQLNVGYACLIQNRYTLSATYHMGLTDVSKNAAFHSDKTDRNSGLRLTIGYKLF